MLPHWSYRPCWNYRPHQLISRFRRKIFLISRISTYMIYFYRHSELKDSCWWIGYRIFPKSRKPCQVWILLQRPTVGWRTQFPHSHILWTYSGLVTKYRCHLPSKRVFFMATTSSLIAKHVPPPHPSHDQQILIYIIIMLMCKQTESCVLVPFHLL